MEFKSELIDPTPPPTKVRRVVIELPEDRARELAKIIDLKIIWSDTYVEDELSALYDALVGAF